MRYSKSDAINSSIRPLCEGGNECASGQNYCEEHDCQECCPHNEFDHYICLDCGYEKCPGDYIDAAEYSFGDER